MESRAIHVALWVLSLCAGLCFPAACGGSGAGADDGASGGDGPGSVDADIGGGDSAPSDGPRGDGSTNADVGSGICPGGDGAQELAPVSAMFPGPRTICGTAIFPADTIAGRQIRFILRQPGIGAEVIDVGDTDAIDHVQYRVAVEVGTYLIGLEIDQVSDMMLGAGDYRGFFDGTLAAPKNLEVDATPVDVTMADRTDIDFGLGAYP